MNQLIINCEFENKCPQKLAKLQPTADPDIRFCDVCQAKVYSCKTAEELARHTQAGHCVAFAYTGSFQFAEDDLVQINAGYFQGFEGRIDDLDLDAGTANVLPVVFGRIKPVCIDLTDLTKPLSDDPESPPE